MRYGLPRADTIIDHSHERYVHGHLWNVSESTIYVPGRYESHADRHMATPLWIAIASIAAFVWITLWATS